MSPDDDVTSELWSSSLSPLRTKGASTKSSNSSNNNNNKGTQQLGANEPSGAGLSVTGATAAAAAGAASGKLFAPPRHWQCRGGENPSIILSSSSSLSFWRTNRAPNIQRVAACWVLALKNDFFSLSHSFDARSLRFFFFRSTLMLREAIATSRIFSSKINTFANNNHTKFL